MDHGENCIMINFTACILHLMDVMGRTCGTHGEGKGVYRVLVGRAEGKRPLGRPRRRGEDNIKMDLRETEIDGAN
jgi:hypothetical protein